MTTTRFFRAGKTKLKDAKMGTKPGDFSMPQNEFLDNANNLPNLPVFTHAIFKVYIGSNIVMIPFNSYINTFRSFQ